MEAGRRGGVSVEIGLYMGSGEDDQLYPGGDVRVCKRKTYDQIEHLLTPILKS